MINLNFVNHKFSLFLGMSTTIWGETADTCSKALTKLKVTKQGTLSHTTTTGTNSYVLLVFKW